MIVWLKKITWATSAVQEKLLNLLPHLQNSCILALSGLVSHMGHMSCMNLTEPLESYMLPGQMGEEAWPNPRPLPLVSR